MIMPVLVCALCLLLGALMRLDQEGRAANPDPNRFTIRVHPIRDRWRFGPRWHWTVRELDDVGGLRCRTWRSAGSTYSRIGARVEAADTARRRAMAIRWGVA